MIKRYLPAVILPFLLLAASCNKTDDTPEPTPVVYSWKAGAATYCQATWSLSGTDYSFYDTSGNYITFYFNARPTADASYAVMRTLTPGALQVLVSAGASTSGNPYLSTGHDGVSAAVRVTNNKITIALPEIWARPAGRDDSLKVSGTLSQ